MIKIEWRKFWQYKGVFGIKVWPDEVYFQEIDPSAANSKAPIKLQISWWLTSPRRVHREGTRLIRVLLKRTVTEL